MSKDFTAEQQLEALIEFLLLERKRQGNLPKNVKELCRSHEKEP
jgi:hypothetical protein